MLGVTVTINDKCHTFIGAVRQKPKTARIEANTICTYKVINDEGQVLGYIEHRYGNGACVLAMKLLELYGHSGKI